ncbi:unnamed protein product [Cuscuta campestris]|uniref:Uncharacterized protein n=1 Tax=Cuscuta campestris TaxID=132261 RepID=A0A484L7P1_9ASTE|nr:unnamed protein product [Cuscuta campestris]
MGIEIRENSCHIIKVLCHSFGTFTKSVEFVPKLINMSGGHGVVPCDQSIPEGSRCGEAASMFVNGGADDR